MSKYPTLTNIAPAVTLGQSGPTLNSVSATTVELLDAAGQAGTMLSDAPAGVLLATSTTTGGAPIRSYNVSIAAGATNVLIDLLLSNFTNGGTQPDLLTIVLGSVLVGSPLCSVSNIAKTGYAPLAGTSRCFQSFYNFDITGLVVGTDIGYPVVKVNDYEILLPPFTIDVNL